MLCYVEYPVRRNVIQELLPFVWKNPVIPGRFQMKRFIPVEFFRKKSNTFSPFLRKRPKFFVSFIQLTSARLPLEAEGEKWRSFPRRVLVFCKWYNSNPSLFLETFSRQYHLSEFFYRNFLTNGKHSRCLASSLYQSKSWCWENVRRTRPDSIIGCSRPLFFAHWQLLLSRCIRCEESRSFCAISNNILQPTELFSVFVTLYWL